MSLLIKLTAILYKLLRPILFLSNPETAHSVATSLGEWLGSKKIINQIVSAVFNIKDEALTQNITGIKFDNPVGLAAGFDYEARLGNIMADIGFGSSVVGTITNKPYDGNTGPWLGRLIKSQSLMVNKGFKNPGIDSIIEKHKNGYLAIPTGLSIGKTNSQHVMSQTEAVADIVSTFKKAESAKLPFSYYELNISCPNLFGNVEFYSPEHLRELLSAITELKLSKPVFIKMPINESDDSVRKMLDTIIQFSVAGVIFGNLQKNKHDPSIIPSEAVKFDRGYFSGKPTEKRSNELIKLAFSEYGRKLTIIGCGGIFNAEDAYKKIRLGASLVQLITGLIYIGPQLPAQINLGLIELLKRDGFNNIFEAIGIDSK
jgi:dihydroorotate dehydrogenase subfamily 2